MFCTFAGMTWLTPDSELCHFMRTDQNTTKLCTSFFFRKVIKIMKQKQVWVFGLNSHLNLSTGVARCFSIKPILDGCCCKTLRLRCLCGSLALNVFNNSYLSHTNKQTRNCVKTRTSTVQNHGMKLQCPGILVY